MIKNRKNYFLICVILIVLGTLSRQFDFIPLFIGDILYSCLIYFGICFLSPTNKAIVTTLLALLFCYTIEFSQLYRATWLINLRKTVLGHYILGEGFLITDLIYYSQGIIVSAWIDLKTKTQNSKL